MAWLGQNLMMCFTVALRNYHYTDAYGLTFKRIGVWLFLVCTATGLYFLGRQVRGAVYLVLATAAIPNWPGLITRYNFQEARMVLDEDYLARLMPYNIDVWADYDKDIIRRSSHDYYVYTSTALTTPDDFRDWDFGQARRAQMFTSYLADESKVLDASEAVEIAPEMKEHGDEVLNEIDYDISPGSEIEVITPNNN